jgi:hypothetical protein
MGVMRVVGVVLVGVTVAAFGPVVDAAPAETATTAAKRLAIALVTRSESGSTL